MTQKTWIWGLLGVPGQGPLGRPKQGFFHNSQVFGPKQPFWGFSENPCFGCFFAKSFGFSTIKNTQKKEDAVTGPCLFWVFSPFFGSWRHFGLKMSPGPQKGGEKAPNIAYETRTWLPERENLSRRRLYALVGTFEVL